MPNQILRISGSTIEDRNTDRLVQEGIKLSIIAMCWPR